MQKRENVQPLSPRESASLPLEIERKYLISMPDIDRLLSVPFCRVLQIEQIYLLSDAGESSRIRRIEENGSFCYFYTRKRAVTSVTRIEEEDAISAEEYRRLILLADPAKNPIRKTRYCFPYAGKLFEIDVYPFWKKQAVLEVELDSEEEAILFPPEITILREVTEDLSFRNSSLALKENRLYE